MRASTLPPPRLIAHLDLKGVLLKPEFYKDYLHRLKAFGYDAVVVEYEDVFPFEGACFSERPEERWSHPFLKEFLDHAEAIGVEVIPLQQCLGHLEYAFRWARYRGMALPFGTPRDLHVGLPEAREWMKRLLIEMLEAHPDSRYIHLGMDEARPLLLYADEVGVAALNLFLDYLDELCTLCEEHGKMPLIWSDMLEDHIALDNIYRIAAFRDRVILVPWNYSASGAAEVVVRFSGMRCSREWHEGRVGEEEGAELRRDGLLYFEDWPEELCALVEEYRVSPWQMEPLFQAGVWRKLGFRVWGGAGGGITQDRSLLPHYHWRNANVARWLAAVQRFGLEGVIVTQWARSNSCSSPNLLPDVVWPILAGAGGRDGGRMFPGLPQTESDALFNRLGKCREGWRIEQSLLAEMGRLEPFITEHHYEWRTLAFVLRVQQAHRQLDEAQSLAECYLGFGRFMRAGWRPIQNDLQSAKKALEELEGELRDHLSLRYSGGALQEWFAKVFTFPTRRLDDLLEKIEESIAKHERNPAFVDALDAAEAR